MASDLDAFRGCYAPDFWVSGSGIVADCLDEEGGSANAGMQRRIAEIEQELSEEEEAQLQNALRATASS